jgi:predicted nucleotidyltransferase
LISLASRYKTPADFNQRNKRNIVTVHGKIKIKLPKKEINDFCLKWKISEMALFGSVLSDEFRPDSDIDIMVSFKDEAGWGLFDFVDMIDELKAIFGRKVDLVEKDSLRNPFRRQTILAGNEVIYAA